MFCQNCGAVAGESQKFCGSCGVSLLYSRPVNEPQRDQNRTVHLMWWCLAIIFGIWAVHFVLSAPDHDARQNAPNVLPSGSDGAPSASVAVPDGGASQPLTISDTQSTDSHESPDDPELRLLPNLFGRGAISDGRTYSIALISVYQSRIPPATELFVQGVMVGWAGPDTITLSDEKDPEKTLICGMSPDESQDVAALYHAGDRVQAFGAYGTDSDGAQLLRNCRVSSPTEKVVRLRSLQASNDDPRSGKPNQGLAPTLSPAEPIKPNDQNSIGQDPVEVYQSCSQATQQLKVPEQIDLDGPHDFSSSEEPRPQFTFLFSEQGIDVYAVRTNKFGPAGYDRLALLVFQDEKVRKAVLRSYITSGLVTWAYSDQGSQDWKPIVNFKYVTLDFAWFQRQSELEPSVKSAIFYAPPACDSVSEPPGARPSTMIGVYINASPSDLPHDSLRYRAAEALRKFQMQEGSK